MIFQKSFLYNIFEYKEKESVNKCLKLLFFHQCFQCPRPGKGIPRPPPRIGGPPPPGIALPRPLAAWARRIADFPRNKYVSNI